MKIINALSVFDIKVKLIDGKWILLSRVVSPDYARLKNDYAAKDYTYITKDSYTTTETIINDDYLKLEDSLAALQAKIDGLSESLMNDRFELFKLQASVNESSDDVNNTTKVASTESNNPTSNVSQTDWSGYFSNSGTGSNSSLTTNFTGLETSNNAQSKIVSGVNTTLIIESRIDSSGDGVDYRSLTVDTDTNDHYGANRFTNVNDSSNGSYTYTGWGEWNGSATITSTFGGSTQTSTITHGHWVAMKLPAQVCQERAVHLI